jgi:hypothetical protein
MAKPLVGKRVININSTAVGAGMAVAAAVGSTLVLQISALSLPFFQRVLGTVALSPPDLGLAVGLAGGLLGAVELEKWVRRRRGSP